VTNIILGFLQGLGVLWMQISNNNAVEKLLAAQNAAVQTNEQIGVAVSKKQLDAQKQMGDAVIQMLEQAVAISQKSSTSIDVKA
jgi:hypothetical protein